MNISQVHKLSRASQLSLVAVVILIGAVFFTVNSALQEQNTASNASTGPNLLVNPSFESGISPWELRLNSPGNGSLATTTATAADGATSAKVVISTAGNTSDDVQIKQKNMSVTAGKTYRVSFWAKATSARQIYPEVQQVGTPNQIYGKATIGITTTWQQYSYTFTSAGSETDAFVGFSFGLNTGTVWIDGVNYSTYSASTPTATPIPTLKPQPTTVPTAKPTAIPTTKPTTVPTAKPTVAPTIIITIPPITIIPTKAPTPTCAPPPTCFQNGALICAMPLYGWCGYPTPTPTVKPTAIPTATPTPQPTAVPVPTNTPVPGSTVLAITVGLHGIGTGGDSANPGSTGNTSPLHPTRTIIADIYDTQNQLVVSQQGSVVYNTATGKFDGTVDLGTGFTSGLYTVKVKTDQYLRALVPGIQTITQGQTNTLPAATLVAGDINGDNAINIVDYNILIGCYSDLLPATNCNATDNVLSDITDDGHVNQFDYNLFLRELTNIGGQ